MQEFNELLQLNDISATVRLKINYKKTKFVCQELTHIAIQNHNLENVERLGHDIRLRKLNQDAEIKTGMQLPSAGFGRLAYILKKNFPSQ